MKNTRRALCALGAVACASLLALAAPAPALAQEYPSKPIRLVVPQPPGGPTDIVARLVAQKLSERLGQQVVVDNKPGAGSNIGTEIVAKAPKDGYTLVMATVQHIVNPFLFASMPFDPVKDFAPISMLGTVPNVLVVHPAFEAKSVADLIRMAREKPGFYHYASAGNGTLNHLVGEMLKSRAGIDLKHIPYRGIAPALSDVIAGHVPISFANLPAAISQIQAGTVRALGVSTLKRNSFVPEVPTIAETVPGFDAELWIAIYAIAGTPQPIVDKLVAATHRAMTAPEIKAKFAQQGAEVVTSTPAELAAKLEADLKTWAEIVKASGARIE